MIERFTKQAELCRNRLLIIVQKCDLVINLEKISSRPQWLYDLFARNIVESLWSHFLALHRRTVQLIIL